MLINTATEADGALRRPNGIYSGLLGGGAFSYLDSKRKAFLMYTHTLTLTHLHTHHTRNNAEFFTSLHGWELPSNNRDEASPKLSVSLGTSFCKTGAVLLLAKMSPIRLGSHLSTPLGSQKMWQS